MAHRTRFSGFSRMPAKAKSSNQCVRKCRARCKAWTAFTVRLVIYMSLATLANLRCCWNWLLEPQGVHCNLPSRGAPVNKTRMKVLVYGFAKTGTTSTVRLLNQIYDRVYHTEDNSFHIWSAISDEFWVRRENNGSIWYWDRLATPAYPAYKGHSFYERRERKTDYGIVYPVAGREPRIAEALEKCHADGLSFDGSEKLFWNMYERSPEAKVIMLNWRSWDSFLNSQTRFDWDKYWLLFVQNLLQCGYHFLPWGALIVPVWDAMTNTTTEVLRNGLELHSRNFDVGYHLFRVSIMERRIIQHWFGGLEIGAANKEEFEAFWEYGKRRIPKERLFEMDVTKHSPADVCRALGVTDRPICKDTGKIENVYPLLRPEKENPMLFVKTGALYLFFHWVNHTLLWGVIYWVCGRVRSFFLAVLGCCSSGKAKAKKKSKSA